MKIMEAPGLYGHFSVKERLIQQIWEKGDFMTDKIRTLEDKKVNANLFYESVRTNGYKWSFVNKYWVDPRSGLVLKTIQKVHPRLPSITIHYYYKFSRG